LAQQLQEQKGGEKASRKCPRCHSKRLWKNGTGKTKIGFPQRFICRDCGYRPSESSVLSINRGYSGSCQVCAFLTEAKNLPTVETRKNGLAGATNVTTQNIEGKIAEFEYYLLKQGYRESTIKRYTHEMEILNRRGANIFNPESVKATIAKQKWKDSRKLGVCHVYNAFLTLIGKQWEQPIYRAVSTHPFIPTKSTLEQIIAGAGKKTSIFFQLLMETGARSGEAEALIWDNIDIERCVLRIEPEKNSKPRTIKVSRNLINRLIGLKRKDKRVFGKTTYNNRRTCWGHTRKRLARKLNNPEITKVTFHTVRHWYATTLFHETRNLPLVQRRLGHRNINSTLIYIQIEEELYLQSPDDKFICEFADSPEKAKNLIEEGFEYIGKLFGEQTFRKRM